MRGNADDRTEPDSGGTGDREFRALMKEARVEARHRRLGRPTWAEPDFALRTQHAEFGAAAH
ncbi:hypothetical protein [Streptomyces sp. NPDC004284]|uniref:hypothetical protein n=1 Tax=Streptomyces sp. NPDC004284 TaxID=3364695 RepID=UPI0036B791BA